MVALSSATGDSSANDVSGDGSVIVGNADGEAFIWTPEDGARQLRDVLANNYGLSEALSDWTNLRAAAISADGRTIVGNGSTLSGLNQGWYASLRSPIHTWNADGDGNWSSPSNWTGGVPNNDHATSHGDHRRAGHAQPDRV
jgi:uncharacterized membrane protein